MNGAECLLRTLVASGVDTCFMNPGTSEMQFVAALDGVPEMRPVLCLFEGVAAGAADGYARMTGRPAATLLHLGPGLANGLSNFHNAKKARSPVVSIVGQHSTAHLRHDAPLTADIEAIARPMSAWVRTVERVEDIGLDTADAIQVARMMRGVATLIVPADFSWSEAGAPGAARSGDSFTLLGRGAVREIVSILQSGEPAALLLGGRTLAAHALESAAKVSSRFGARILGNRYGARYVRGGGRAAPARLPYFPEPAEAALAGLKHLILVESAPPVAFFGYPGRRSLLAPEDCAIHVLASPDDDGSAALHALARECGVDGEATPAANLPMPEWPASGPLTLDAIGRAMAHLLPEKAIVAEEAVSSGEPILRHLAAAAVHDHLPVTGGSIGQGLPVAVGAAIACPERKVIALEADGSGLYTPQALWTMAREHLDVTVVILSNRRYRILDIEMERTGGKSMGPRANDMVDLTRPAIDWVKLAEGLGVEAKRATTVDAFVQAFREGVAREGPVLIELVVE